MRGITLNSIYGEISRLIDSDFFRRFESKERSLLFMDIEQHIKEWFSLNGGGDIKSFFSDAYDNPSFSKYSYILKRGYAIEKNLETESILYIGMNPSYDTRRESPSGFYPAFDHWYYTRIKDITNKVNEELKTNFKFAHHDLYFVRHTSQNDVLAMKTDMQQFFKTQLDITKSIIEAAKPKLIVVANAGACKIFQAEMYEWRPGTPEQFDKSLGVDFIKIGKSRVPVLFTGMISGQRALDDGSYSSLIWHICHILKSL